MLHRFYEWLNLKEQEQPEEEPNPPLLSPAGPVYKLVTHKVNVVRFLRYSPLLWSPAEVLYAEKLYNKYYDGRYFVIPLDHESITTYHYGFRVPEVEKNHKKYLMFHLITIRTAFSMEILNKLIDYTEYLQGNRQTNFKKIFVDVMGYFKEFMQMKLPILAYYKRYYTEDFHQLTSDIVNYVDVVIKYIQATDEKEEDSYFEELKRVVTAIESRLREKPLAFVTHMTRITGASYLSKLLDI